MFFRERMSLHNLAGLPLCRTPFRPGIVPGYHAFGFKIATAALRPRNDKSGGFYGTIRTFSFLKV